MNTLILTIDPGSRTWGVSVFAGRTFHASFIKNLSAKDSPANRLPQTRKTFRFLFRRYCPGVLVLKVPRKSWFKQSKYLSAMFTELRRLARIEGVKVVELTPEKIREVLCDTNCATTDDFLQAIRCFDPDLGDWLIAERKRIDRFRWSRLMTSVALGVCYVNRKKERVRGTSP